IQAQPRKIISSPTWSGLEDEHVSYNAGYTNVHELIPWRTLSGQPLRAVQVRRFLREQGVAEFKLPDRVECVASLPLTPVGKVDK
ncbi:hypothetical protein MJN85_29505, partial [Salmonella enterica subsp. enterica serovar Anatum]|nr:hypothetical protein [Salmonella enterica subsp. enterica serovar Anatum]